MNLLSNAVKYMPENGDVKLEVYEEKLAESGIELKGGALPQ